MAKPGICNLCQKYGPLTFEHIPPKRAFNRTPLAIPTIYDFMVMHKHGKSRLGDTRFPRGMGCSSLCERCNGFTARWYGKAFADWTIQAMRVADRLPPRCPVLIPFEIEPLRVIKQIATMALAATRPGFGNYSDLCRFALSPLEAHVPRPYRFHVYINPQQHRQYRLSDFGVALDAKSHLFSITIAEVACPPLGYVVSLYETGDKALADQRGLTEINHFGRFRLGESVVLYLQLPALVPAGPMPLQYAAIG